jgi:hypothetical protein
MDSLPAEIICAILHWLDTDWWPLAAQTCSWWRACVHAAAMMTSIPTFAITAVGTQTLSAAVRGGHVNVIEWMEQTSGRGYEHARDMAQWMASAPPCRSWADVLAAAARGDRDDVLVWANERFYASVGDASSTCVNRLPEDVVMMAAIGCGRWQKIERLCMSGPPTQRKRAMRMLGKTLFWSMGDPRNVTCIIASGNLELLTVLCSARCSIDRSDLLVAALCTDDHVFDRLRNHHKSHLLAPLSADEATWLAGQRLISTRGGGAHSDSPPIGERDVFRNKRPSLRSPRPDDFLPGGALEQYLSIDNEARFGQALDSLLWPLCVDPGYTKDHLDAWIKSALIEFKACNPVRRARVRHARVRRRTFRLGNSGGLGAAFDGDETNIP